MFKILKKSLILSILLTLFINTATKSVNFNDVTKYSHKKAWWKCKKEHEWETTVASRSNGHGCPYCARRNRKKNK